MEDPTKKSTDIASRFLSSTPTNVTSLKHRSAVIAADRLKANSANPWFIPTFEEEQIRLMEEFDEQMRRRKQEFQASQKLQARVKGKNERRNPTKPTRGSGAASPGPAEDVAGYEDVAPVLSAEEKAAADAFEAEQQVGTGWVDWWADGSKDRRVGFTPHSTTHYHPTVSPLAFHRSGGRAREGGRRVRGRQRLPSGKQVRKYLVTQRSLLARPPILVLASQRTDLHTLPPGNDGGGRRAARGGWEEGKVGNAASAASCHGTRAIERASVATRSIDSQKTHIERGPLIPSFTYVLITDPPATILVD